MVSAPVDAAMASGDVLLVSFWMRSGAAGVATLDAGSALRASGRSRAPGGRPRRAGSGGTAVAPEVHRPERRSPREARRGGGGFVGGFSFGGRGGMNAPATAGDRMEEGSILRSR